MCDYSLLQFPNRLATEGEELVAQRFPSGCIGFVAVSECPKPQAKRIQFWAELKSWLLPRSADSMTAVCIPPGSTVLLSSIPPTLSERHWLNRNEQAEFIQQSADEFTYRDGLRFENGQEISLQRLAPGQRAIVVSMIRSEDLFPIAASAFGK